MISEELVVDDAARLGVPERWNGDASCASRIRDRVEFMEPSHAAVGARYDVTGFSERPALATGLLKGVGERHERLEPFERAHQSGAMSPRAGDGAVKMVSAGLGRKLGLGFAADALTENRIAFEVEPFRVVLDEDILSAPFPVDELSHSTSPPQSKTPLWHVRALYLRAVRSAPGPLQHPQPIPKA